MAYGFLVDANNCIGCRTCAVACKDANSYELGVGFREVRAFATGEYPEVRQYNVPFDGSRQGARQPMQLFASTRNP